MTPQQAAAEILVEWKPKYGWFYPATASDYKPVSWFEERAVVLRDLDAEWQCIVQCMVHRNALQWCQIYSKEQPDWGVFSRRVVDRLHELAKDYVPAEPGLTKLAPFDYKKIPKRIEIRDGETIYKEIKW